MECDEPAPPAIDPVNTAPGPAPATTAPLPCAEEKKHFKTFPACAPGACSEQCGSLCPGARSDEGGSDLEDYVDCGTGALADGPGGAHQRDADRPDHASPDLRPAPSTTAHGGTAQPC